MLRRFAQSFSAHLGRAPSIIQQSCLDASTASLFEASAPTSSLLGRTWNHASGACTQLQLIRDKYTYAFKRAANTPGLVFWKPRTPGQRHKITIDYEGLGIYTGDPVKHLSFRKANSGGRNSHGRVTVWGRGGGIKKVVRMVDYARQDTNGSPGVVKRIELDPNRTGFLALVSYSPDPVKHPGAHPELRYHIAQDGLRVGDVLHSGPDAPVRPGSMLKLRDIPLGVSICNIELEPGKGGIMARAAGAGAVIQFKEQKFAVVRLPSGEVRRIDLDCHATIGSVSNPLLKLTNMGKAGTNRLRGRRPKVRGIAMNPVDHPHGGRTNGGRPSCTPWGVYCKGKKTRRRNKWTNKFIITRRDGQPMSKFEAAKKWRAAAERERKARSGASAPPAHMAPAAVLLGPAPPKWGSVSV